MIRPEKYLPALTALQQILVRARYLAREQEQLDKLVDLLDAAEYLPGLIADAADRTEDFAGWVREISERYPYCRNIYLEFSNQSSPQARPEPAHELQAA